MEESASAIRLRIKSSLGGQGVRAASWGAVGGLALPLAAFITAPLLARNMTVADRGYFALFASMASVLAGLAKYGLDDAILVAVGQHQAIPHRHLHRVRLFLSGAAAFATLLGIVILISLGAGRASWALLLLPVTQLLIPPRSALLALTRLKPLALETWLQASLRLSGFAILAVFGFLSAGNAAWVQMAAISVAGVPLLIAVRRVPRTTDESSVPIWAFGPSSLLATFGGVIILRLDQLVLAGFSGAEELGLYAAAVALAEVPLLASGLIKNAYQGRIAAAKDASLMRRPLMFLVVAGILCMPVALLAPNVILSLLYGDRYTGAAEMLSILLIACIPAAVSDLATSASVALGVPRDRTISLGSAALVTVIFLVPSIIWFGGEGAAVTSLISYSVAAALALRRLRTTQMRVTIKA